MKAKAVFSGFSVDDLEKAEKFYTEILGLEAEDEKGMGLRLQLPNGGTVFVYSKDDHQPATFTILNFAVDDIDEAVKDLKDKGVVFEHYDDMTGEDGIARGLAANRGPDIAWFKDPAGNIVSVLQDS
jgi:catechol 2,3-dioxygenase-like lactoylglutathione lyase family enzyme